MNLDKVHDDVSIFTAHEDHLLDLRTARTGQCTLDPNLLETALLQDADRTRIVEGGTGVERTGLYLFQKGRMASVAMLRPQCDRSIP